MKKTKVHYRITKARRSSRSLERYIGHTQRTKSFKINTYSKAAFSTEHVHGHTVLPRLLTNFSANEVFFSLFLDSANEYGFG